MKNNAFKKVYMFLYNLIDKAIVIPISRVIYNINDYQKKHSGKFEKLLNRPNVLIYFSLFLAIILFLLVDTKAVNLINEEAEIINNQPVKVIYNEEAYVVDGVPEDVDITLIGRKSDLYLAKQIGEHEVVLDLSGYTEGQHKVRLKYNHSIESVKYKIDPSIITVKISEKISQSKVITYDILNEDKLDPKLSIKNITLDRSEVIIKGSNEHLEEVAKVKALIDLEAAKLTDKGEFTLDSIPLVAYNKEGDKIEKIEIVPEKINAVVEVDSYYKEVPVKVQTQGKLAPGFALDKVEPSVSKIGVYGSKEEIEQLKFIEANIDINGLTEDKSFTVNIKRTPGVRHLSEKVINVDVKLGTETTKEFADIQIEAVNLGSDFTITALTGDDRVVTVIAKAVKNAIEGIDESAIRAEIDLSGLTAGNHEVPINVYSDDVRVRLTPKTSVVNVRISKKSS